MWLRRSCLQEHRNPDACCRPRIWVRIGDEDDGCMHFRSPKELNQSPSSRTVEPMSINRATHIVLYDDQCPLCTFQMKLLTWLDWLNVLSLAPVSQARSAALAPRLTREEMLEAIHCVALDGRIYRGARCIRFLGLRLPLLIPLALILWVPGVI